VPAVTESGRFILATLCGLVLAGIVHLLVVLGIPYLAEHDAFSRLGETVSSDTAEVVASPTDSDTWLPRADPNMAVGACAFDLEEGPVRIAAKTGGMFESLSFHSRGAGVFFAVTDRAAVRGNLEIVVLTRRQLDEILAREDEEEPSRDVRIVAPARQGLAVVRVLANLPSRRAEAEEAIRSVSCTIDPMPGKPRPQP
jgi:uncharacterized membrane protein